MEEVHYLSDKLPPFKIGFLIRDIIRLLCAQRIPVLPFLPLSTSGDTTAPTDSVTPTRSTFHKLIYKHVHKFGIFLRRQSFALVFSFLCKLYLITDDI